jgi:hypothetical protein
MKPNSGTRGALLLALLSAAVGCGSRAAAPTPILRRGQEVRPLRVSADVVSWRPEIAPVDSGGECSAAPLPGMGVRALLVQFPARATARASLIVTLDSTNTPIRFTDSRGVLRTPGFAQAKTEAERDSVLREARRLVRRTTISYDFATGTAMAINLDGGRPDQAVSGAITLFDTLPAMGAPRRRMQRALAICEKAGVR